MSRRAARIERHFRLNDKVRTASRSSNEHFVRDVQDILKDFELSQVIGTKYNWRYLPDDVFQKRLIEASTPNIYAANYAFLSHLFRVIEAFRLHLASQRPRRVVREIA